MFVIRLVKYSSECVNRAGLATPSLPDPGAALKAIRISKVDVRIEEIWSQ